MTSHQPASPSPSPNLEQHGLRRVVVGLVARPARVERPLRGGALEARVLARLRCDVMWWHVMSCDVVWCEARVLARLRRGATRVVACHCITPHDIT